jgi:hypothetical protein
MDRSVEQSVVTNWRQNWALCLMLIVMLPLLAGCGLLSAFACSAEERAVFAEFPQYGGLQIEPEGHPDMGSCAAFYETSDSPEQVLAYFKDQLKVHGWTLEAELTEFRKGQAGGDLLMAHRDDFVYNVSYESLEFYMDPRPGTHVAVHVAKR